jgi:UDP-2-acetamido-3-amino-2,3-dideoxy-glucuronate N-acetyltransferase
MARFFKHRAALVESDEIGTGTRIWAFSHVMKGARLGKDCNIGEHCYIEDQVLVGDEVVIKNGVSLWRGVELGDRVFVGPNAVFTNDLIPRSKVFKPFVKTTVRRGASVGANATVRCGIVIGRHALIGAGAVVTHDVPDFAIVHGNPARQRGYICSCGRKLGFGGTETTSCACGISYVHKNQGVSVVGESAEEVP